jgi:hypothetical protein
VSSVLLSLGVVNRMDQLKKLGKRLIMLLKVQPIQ